MGCCLVAVYKAPGTCPVVIGDIILRLLSKCVLLVTDITEKDACAQINFYARLGSGI